MVWAMAPKGCETGDTKGMEIKGFYDTKHMLDGSTLLTEHYWTGGV